MEYKAFYTGDVRFEDAPIFTYLEDQKRFDYKNGIGYDTTIILVEDDFLLFKTENDVVWHVTKQEFATFIGVDLEELLSDRDEEHKEHHIWIEGHRATGESSQASYIGVGYGPTFAIACEEFAARNPSFNNLFNKERLTYWGCGLFNNEADARKTFG